MTSISNRNKHLFVTETRVDKRLTPEQAVNNFKLLKKYMPETLPDNIDGYVKANPFYTKNQLLNTARDVLGGKTILFDAIRNNEYLPPCRTYEVQIKKSPKHKKNKVKELNKMVSQAKAEQKAEQQARLLDITSKTVEIKQTSMMQNIVGKTKSIIRKALQTALSKAALL